MPAPFASPSSEPASRDFPDRRPPEEFEGAVQRRRDRAAAHAVRAGALRRGAGPSQDEVRHHDLPRDARRPAGALSGNVTFGEDLTLARTQRFYDAVVYTVGASADRRLDIPGEELAGNLSATEFVAWYNGHPDHATRKLELDAQAVAVVGMGNVAVDVTRILAKHVDELHGTDIPHAVLEVLGRSRVSVSSLGNNFMNTRSYFEHAPY